MRTSKSIHTNIILNVIKTFSTALFPLISFMYVTRIFGVDGYGRISFSKTYVNYFLLFAMLGVENYGAREAAKVRDCKEKLSKTIYEILFVNLFSMVLCYLVLFISLISIERLHNYSFLIILFSVEIFFQVIGIEWVNVALENYKYITIRTVCFQAVSLVATIFLVHSFKDVFVYIIIQVTAIALTSIMNISNLIRSLNPPRNIDFSCIAKRVLPILFFFLLTASVSIFRQMDTLMLGFMKDDNAVGLYSAGDKMSAMISRVVSAISAVLLPRLSYYSEKGDKKKIYDIINKMGGLILMVAIPISMGVFFLSNEIVDIFSGKEFTNAVLTTCILSLRVVLSPINTLFTINLFIPIGWEKKSLFALSLAAVLDFCINLFLIPNFSYNGAAIATVIAEIAEFIVILVFARRIIRVRHLMQKGLYYAMVSLVIPAFYFVSRFIFSDSSNLTVILKIMVVFFASTILYFSILYISKNETFLECCRSFSKKTCDEGA